MLYSTPLPCGVPQHWRPSAMRVADCPLTTAYTDLRVPTIVYIDQPVWEPSAFDHERPAFTCRLRTMCMRMDRTVRFLHARVRTSTNAAAQAEQAAKENRH